jgi:hypothetical protein
MLHIMMTVREMVPETSASFNHLTWLSAKEDYKLMRLDSFAK